MAEEYLKSEKYKLSRQFFLKALNIAPKKASNLQFRNKILKHVKTLDFLISKSNQKKKEKNSLYVEKCVNNARKYLDDNDLNNARKKISNCLKTNGQNVKAIILSADILARLGKYKSAIAEYNRAKYLQKKKKNTGDNFEENNPPNILRAFCHYKLGKTLFRTHKIKLAARHYKKALDITPNDINVLLGMAECHEYKTDYKEAAHYYKRVLMLEPSNNFANRKIEDFKVRTMGKEDIIKELKLRGAIAQNTEFLTVEMKKMFYLMRESELHYAVDYLKSKNVMLAGNIIKIKNPAGEIKLFLNGRGFKVYKRLITRDAVNYFEKKNINLRDIFLLRDKAGEKIFDKKGNLTPCGLRVFWLASEGQKSWIMPYETPPGSIQDEKVNKEVGNILKMGYREISEPEFLWLLKATDCPVDILTPPENTYLKIVRTKNHDKYFLCYISPSSCSLHGNSNILSTYIEKYRMGDDSILTGKTSTAFFGSGATKKRKFCHNGKIWQ